jgi:hypothetical protein
VSEQEAAMIDTEKLTNQKEKVWQKIEGRKIARTVGSPRRLEAGR